MKQTDIRSHRRFLTASSILGAAAAFNPAAIRSAFATSNITAEEESMTATIAVRDSSTVATGNSAIRPFQKINIPEAELTELRRRINNTRWPERETVTDATQGVQLATTQALARYWATEYDWRKIEGKLNAAIHHRDRRTGHSFHSRPFKTRKCVAAHRYARMARLDHRTVEDHRSANQSHRTRRKCIRRVPYRGSVDAGVRVFRQADDDRLGP